MTAPTTPRAASFPRAGSQLATGATLTGARRASIQIAKARRPLGGLGDAGGPPPPRTARNHLSSSKHQPTHNIRGQCSERNKSIPVRVRNDADLRAGRAHLSWKRPALRFFSLVGLLACHPSFRSPVAVTAGVSQPQRDSSGDSIVGISHRALGITSREIGGHEHVCVR